MQAPRVAAPEAGRPRSEAGRQQTEHPNLYDVRLLLPVGDRGQLDRHAVGRVRLVHSAGVRGQPRRKGGHISYAAYQSGQVLKSKAGILVRAAKMAISVSR